MADHAVEITDANFEETILNAGKPALVDFWAVWCGPCRVIGPIVEELAEEYGDRIVVGKLDVDTNRDTAIKYGIQAIPTLLLVNNGEIADRMPELRDLLIDHLSSHQVEDVVHREGREVVKKQLLDDFNDRLQQGQLLNVYFSDFVVQ